MKTLNLNGNRNTYKIKSPNIETMNIRSQILHGRCKINENKYVKGFSISNNIYGNLNSAILGRQTRGSNDRQGLSPGFSMLSKSSIQIEITVGHLGQNNFYPFSKKISLLFSSQTRLFNYVRLFALP